MEAVLRAFPKDPHHQTATTTLAPNKQNSRIKTQNRRNNIKRSYNNNNNLSTSGLLNHPPLSPLPLHPQTHSLLLSSYYSSLSTSYPQQPPLLPLPNTTASKIHHSHPLQSPKHTTTATSRNMSASFTTKKSSKPTTTMRGNNENDDIVVFSGSFSVVSPPPSSLPMPKFLSQIKTQLLHSRN